MIVVSVPTYKPISCLCLHLYNFSVADPDLGAIGSVDPDPRQKLPTILYTNEREKKKFHFEAEFLIRIH